MQPVKLNYALDLTEDSRWLTVTADPGVRGEVAYVQELGDFDCGGGYFTIREFLPSYQIILTLAGEGILRYEEETRAVPAGTVLWIDCEKYQYYRTNPDVGRWHFLWVHLYGPTVHAYYRAFRESAMGAPVAGIEDPDHLASLLLRLFELYENESNTLQDDLLASSVLTQLMVRCIRAADRALPVRTAPDSVEAIQTYIRQHYREPIDLDTLSQVFSISKYHLQKLFKRHIGLSPAEYLTRTRLAHAKHLLRTTTKSMTDIAEEIGYSGAYFDHVFKKYEDINPRAYRQRWYDSGDSTVPPT